MKLLASLKREGKTIVLASHRIEEVEALADRVMVLEQNAKARPVSLEEWRSEVLPAVDLALWIGEGQRERANAHLRANGWDSHLNGRGTVVVRVRATQKMRALQALAEQGIAIQNFEIEK
jgi:ABC-type uncharacterized transport system ATPase subunit